MQCKEWDDANSELFKESHDEAVHKNSYKSRLYELISASLAHQPTSSLIYLISHPWQAISMTVSQAFTSEGMGRYSKRLWKLAPPVKILGQGSPLKES